MLPQIAQMLAISTGRAYDLAVSAHDSSSITLSFLYVPGAKSYEYSISSTSAFAGFGAYTALPTNKQITGLTASTQYWLKVRAVNGQFKGQSSPVVTASTDAAGGASQAVLFGVGNTGTVTGTFDITGLTFAAGVAVVGFTQQMFSTETVTSVTFHTTGGDVAGIQLAGPLGDASNIVSMWYAPVPAGAGSISAANGGIGFQTISAVGWMLTGLSSNTPSSVASVDAFAANHPDPQGPTATSLVVASGGVAIGFVGKTFGSSPTNFPALWLPAAVVRDPTTEVANATANGCIMAGAHIITPGTYSNITVSASIANGFQFSGMIWAAWH